MVSKDTPGKTSTFKSSSPLSFNEKTSALNAFFCSSIPSLFPTKEKPKEGKSSLGKEKDFSGLIYKY